MPTDNDNEGPGLGLGDLNDIFNDDPFSNAGAESPTGEIIILSLSPPAMVGWHHHQLLLDLEKNGQINVAGAEPGKDGDGEDAEVESQLPGSDPAFRLLPNPYRFRLFSSFTFSKICKVQFEKYNYSH